MRRPNAFSIALCLAVLSGCGGSSHHGGSSALSTDITITAGTDYNGSSADLTGTPTLNPESTAIQYVLSDGTRLFTFLAPESSLVAGGTITAAQGGFAYVETSGTTSKSWAANAGSVTITGVSGGKISAKVNALEFSPSNVGNNAAVGTFTANGTVTNLPIPD